MLCDDVSDGISEDGIDVEGYKMQNPGKAPQGLRHTCLYDSPSWKLAGVVSFV